MKWFGKNWNAPICTAEGQIATPVGQVCLQCGKKIQETDQGLLIPHVCETPQTLEPWKSPLMDSPWHLDCFLSAITARDPWYLEFEGEMMVDKSRNLFISAMKKHNLVKYQPDNPFTLSSGLQSPWYFDVKSALLMRTTRVLITRMLYDALQESRATVAGGPANAAYLLMPLVDRSVCFVMRKAEKGHGIVGKIDGWAPKKDDNVILVEDVITTGGSLLPVIHYVEEQCKAHVEKIIVVVDRNENDQLGKYRDRVQALTTKEDFLDQIKGAEPTEDDDR